MRRILQVQIAPHLVILSDYIRERDKETHKRIIHILSVSPESNLAPAEYEVLAITRRAVIFRAD